jgi:hypothetical protein
VGIRLHWRWGSNRGSCHGMRSFRRTLHEQGRRKDGRTFTRTVIGASNEGFQKAYSAERVPEELNAESGR